MVDGLGLGVAICIKEQRGSFVDKRPLFGILPIGAQTQRDVVVAVEKTGMGTTY